MGVVHPLRELFEARFGCGEMIVTGSVNIPSFFASAREPSRRCLRSEGCLGGSVVDADFGGLSDVVISKSFRHLDG